MSNYNYFLHQDEDWLLRHKKIAELTASNFEGLSFEELKAMWRKVLGAGMHGLCASPYVEGQQPGDQLTEAQVRRRLEIMKPYTNWVRTFSCTEGNELIAKIAKEMGMKTLVGAWLGNEPDKNENELEQLIKLVNDGYVDVAAVGNEVMYRGDLTEQQLLDAIYYTKSKITNDTPVGYVDAYYEFTHRPAITEACDVLLANCYPFWEGCSQEYSLYYMQDMYNKVLNVANGRKVIITETGWPSQGTSLGGAIPSEENAIKYFINTQKWSAQDNIEIFYFSSFDESWKVGNEGDVGAYWGLWDKHENLKF